MEHIRHTIIYFMIIIVVRILHRYAAVCVLMGCRLVILRSKYRKTSPSPQLMLQTILLSHNLLLVCKLLDFNHILVKCNFFVHLFLFLMLEPCDFGE